MGRGFEFEGATVLITGATRGIGRAAAEQMLARGAEVLAVARNEAALMELKAQAPERVHVLAADLARPEMPLAVARWVAAEHPACSGLINNAAIMTHTRLTTPADRGLPGDDPRQAEIARELAINLTAPLTLTAHLLPLLLRKPAPMVANVTSGLAIAPLPEAVAYSASKAALGSATRGLRSLMRVEGREMQMTEVVMALVDTTLSAPARRKMAPEEAARQMLAGIAAGRRRVFVGPTGVLAAIDRISPALADRIIAGKGCRRGGDKGFQAGVNRA
ncbi:SDR family NAD(P)-dependent oxidoreductase [Oceanicola sp. 502str15]|uniref:SDR family NAD(P)-dependent oxidoreductase n=1 Tax=Oceanicola sp. 502str15 TaxID=2696061 RepID=UPI00209635D7|nr:SDR family NAD(P)-dependent oxidoreductase [Oceanicola sp. 502str15]MCO6383192.1 SDR family NAD(P)-dependent oxidoreductase [Oceanicola sp. 502str15]